MVTSFLTLFDVILTSRIDLRPTCGCSFFYLSHWLLRICEIELSHIYLTWVKTSEIQIWCARIADQTVNAKYSSRKLQASEETRLKQLDFMLY